MEEIITKDNLNTYTLGLKGVLSSMGLEIDDKAGSSAVNAVVAKVDTVDGKCDQILTAVSSDDVQGSKITINLVSEGLNISYVLATSGSKVLGQLQNGDSVVVPFGAEYELTPHLSNGTDNFPTRGVATKMEETVTVYGSGYNRVDLGLPSGALWADRNVGARNVEDAGWFFQRGSLTKYYNAFAAPNWNSSNSNYNSYKYSWSNSIDPAYNYMGSAWVTPTSTNISELLNNCNITLEVHNGTQCFVFHGKNGNKLTFPYVVSTSRSAAGTATEYLSSSYDSYSNNYYITCLHFAYPPYQPNINGSVINYGRANGTCCLVRGVLNPT